MMWFESVKTDTEDVPAFQDAVVSIDQKGLIDVEDKIRERIRGCLVYSRSAIRTIDREIDIGSVWALKRLLDVAPDAELQRYVDAQIKLKRQDQYYRLLDNSAPRPTLPTELGSGLNKMIAYTLASIGDPEDRAEVFLREYLVSDFDGYHLTHQLAAIDWSIQSGRAIPEDLIARRGELVRRVLEEQSSDPVFSDLYVERAAMALLVGIVPKEEMLKWVDTVIKNVNSAGLWTSPKVTVEFDDRTFTMIPAPEHTTSLSLLLLALFLDRTY